jgi:hypothetical protein
MWEWNIEGASDAKAGAILYMRIDHGSTQVFVAEEFLYCSDIAAFFEEVGRERVSQRVAGCRFHDTCGTECFSEGPLEG